VYNLINFFRYCNKCAVAARNEIMNSRKMIFWKRLELVTMKKLYHSTSDNNNKNHQNKSYIHNHNNTNENSICNEDPVK